MEVDDSVTFTTNISSIESKTVEWTTILSAATLDGLRDTVHEKQPTLKDRPKTLAPMKKGHLPHF
jgi:hypothetical protein